MVYEIIPTYMGSISSPIIYIYIIYICKYFKQPMFFHCSPEFLATQKCTGQEGQHKTKAEKPPKPAQQKVSEKKQVIYMTADVIF